MKVRRVRFTVRPMMVAVAAVALGLGGWARYRFGEVMRSNYRDSAVFYRLQETTARFHASAAHEQWLDEIRAAEQRWRMGSDPVRGELAWREVGIPPEQRDRRLAK